MDEIEQFCSEFEEFIRRIGHDKKLFELIHVRFYKTVSAAFFIK